MVRETHAPRQKCQCRKDGKGLKQTCERQTEQQCRHDAFQDERKTHDEASAETVGGGAGHQNEQQRRQKLHQPDHAQIEGVAGQIMICQPTDTLTIWTAKALRKRAPQYF